ncbi:MAG: FAD-binding oxidoreductase [Anaerolineales bacterium]|nr:FAD-binding oxidoreductase [Chloroflexota bacterium]MBL6979769.1 FAD-binding oxidoreductase [Anaerolineales bacterium]
MNPSTNVLICGAGIAGIATAYHLAVSHGIKDIVLVDERAPLSLTSDKSTECYRNWWPGPGDAMVSLMNRSIDIIEELAEESGNIFHLNRRGYLYLTADPEKIPAFEKAAGEPSALGAGPLRVYRSQADASDYTPAPSEGYKNLPTGADLILDSNLIRQYFPYLSENVVAALHARRAGWFSAQQLGMYMLDQARAYGVKLVNARVTGVNVAQGSVQSVQLSDGSTISTPTFVNAAGPFVKEVGEMLGVDIPIFTELHLKVSYRDPLGVVPREAPLLIWTDTQTLPWSEEERQFLAEEKDTRWLLSEMPEGAHTRPEGGADSDIMLLLWEYKHQVGRTLEVHPTSSKPVVPPPLDDMYPEIALRGMAALLPRFEEYFERMPQPMLDGGYYTKTKENRLLACPLPVKGAFLIGALSGYGLMSACGAAELLAAHITESDLPTYAPVFSLERYQDPEYLELLEDWSDEGQL